MAEDRLAGHVQREDGGMDDTKGRFRCLVDGCAWKRSNVFRGSAVYHVKKEHPHLKPRIVRAKVRPAFVSISQAVMERS